MTSFHSRLPRCGHMYVKNCAVPLNYRKPESKVDEKIVPFTIKVDEKVLTDVKQRLGNARLKTDIEEPSFQYGFRVSIVSAADVMRARHHAGEETTYVTKLYVHAV